MGELKKEYDTLKSKYKLPDYNKLNDIFEISSIDYGDFLLRDIRKSILEKLGQFLEILEELIQPENNIINMHEYKEFSEEEHTRVLKVFRTLMKLNREGVLATVNDSEKINAEFINTVFEQWPDIKKEMEFISTKLRDAWEKKLFIKEKLEYLG